MNDRPGDGWRKSSASGGGDCVEWNIDRVEEIVWVRHSRSGNTKIPYSFSEWQAFLTGVKNGEADL